MSKKLNEQQSYELMKQLFSEFEIEYQENVPDDQVGFFIVKNGVEEKMSDDVLDFLKDYNKGIHNV